MTSQDTVGRRRRPVSRARRVGNAVIGALAGAAAGAAAAWLASSPGHIVPWIVGILALLGAGLGYRYGRGVVRAAGQSLWEAWW